MILAGDIITLRDYEPLDQILRKWERPVLYVTGNHEYSTRRAMNEEDNTFKAWLDCATLSLLASTALSFREAGNRNPLPIPQSVIPFP